MIYPLLFVWTGEQEHSLDPDGGEHAVIVVPLPWHSPQEVAQLHKVLIAAGHILAIDLRNSGWHSNELVLILLISCLSNVSAPDCA